MKVNIGALLLTGGLTLAANAMAFEPSKPECIAPAKPGGGFDLTCRVISNGFADADLLETPMAVTFMPGALAPWPTTISTPAVRMTAMRWSPSVPGLC
ncbi:hypothetical protein [Marinobacterium aestuariivivens]|uniref:Uncharacterized protein n=1 Tax=Marinobacterium aestuariivivens TaxID=1698799 RepID=A0ABW2A5W4_9GAMM